MATERRCIGCKGSKLEFEQNDHGGTWWCLGCGCPNSWTQCEEEMQQFACPECGGPVYFESNDDFEGLKPGDEVTIVERHDRDDLKAPRCSRHKAQLVRDRRAQMHLVKGGRGA